MPDLVAMAGSGGVGKAIGFALARLGAASLTLFDADERKSGALAASLQGEAPGMMVSVARSIADACESADGLVNCTPLGMVGYGGNAFDGIAPGKRKWVFDAVYTPVETAFLKESRAAGIPVMSGYDLFLYQGVHAFRLFTGFDVDAAALRLALADGAETFI